MASEAKNLKHEMTSEVKNLKNDFQRAKLNVFGRVQGAKQKIIAPNIAQALVGPPVAAAALKSSEPQKPKMSMKLASLLVYTVGVKCRGINKKEQYAPEHIFSLSENAMNKLLKHGMHDLIKHNRTHLVRTYPKGTRVNSTNYEPHRFWSAGAQLVAINWQTCGQFDFTICFAKRLTGLFFLQILDT